MKKLTVVVMFAGAAVGACMPAEDSLSVSASQVIGGEITADFPAVVAVEYPDGLFTGVLVAPTVVLTVGHGVDGVIGSSMEAEGVVRFGESVEAPTLEIATTEALMHRSFDVDTRRYYDIAMIRLAEPATGVPTIPVFDGDLATILSAGDTARIVGYGFTRQNGDDYGTKRTALMNVREVAHRTIEFSGFPQICDGDSGGPFLVDVEGVPHVVGLVSRGDCASSTVATNVPTYWLEFVQPTIDRWEGACTLDGECVTTGCRTPDPDCDPCGSDGTCAEDCPVRDFDCPPGKLVGERCSADEDCESQHCGESPTYPGERRCVLPCSPQLAARICEPEQTCTRPEPDAIEPICTEPFVPQAAGQSCGKDAHCASGVCEDLICAVGCTSSSSCDDGEVCEDVRGFPVCVEAPEGGGCDCSASGTARAPGAAFVLLGLALLGMRRRRS